MELIIAIIVVLGFVIWFYNRKNGLDVNNDGKVDAEDAKEAVKNTVEAVKQDVKKVRGTGKASAKAPAAKPKGTKKK